MNQKKQDTEYKASWLELFFDLVFVAFIAQLTYYLSYHHHHWEDFLQVGLVAYMIFLTWLITTANRNLRQNDEDIIDILAIQSQMLIIMIMSLSLPQAFGDLSWLFFGAMAVNGFISGALIRRFYRLHPERRPKTLNMWWGFFIAACLWAVAGLLPTPYLYIVALSAMTLSVLSPMTRGKGNTTTLLNMHHLLERLGLFLLLVMGEAVLVVALTNGLGQEFNPEKVIIILSGVMLMIGLWWLYFPYINKQAKGKRSRQLQITLHAHNLLYLSLILVATGLRILIKNPGASLEKMWIFLVGVATMIIAFNIIRGTLTHTTKKSIQSTGAFLILLILIIGFCHIGSWPAIAMVPVITALFIVYAVLDYYKHFGKKCVIH